jgi:hypothetical protein
MPELKELDVDLEIKPRRKEKDMTEKPSVTLPGKVERIIKPHTPTEPEKAQISIEGADALYREIRIQNSLTDENGHEVQLKRGTDVEVTIEADKAATTSSGAA